MKTRTQFTSPHLVLLAGASTALFLGSVAANFLLRGGAPYPTPYRPLQELQEHYTRFPDAQRVTGALQFAASITLGLFAAVVTARLRRLKLRTDSVAIAALGGAGASLFLGASALASWVLSQPGVAGDLGSMRATQLVAFASGGVGHTAALGLLLGGVSLPSLRHGLLPRWVCWLGLLLAAVAELSILSLLYPALSPLLPLARFPSLIWIIATGVTLASDELRSSSSVALGSRPAADGSR